MAPPGKLDLLGDDSEGETEKGGIKVNRSYAKRLLHNKKRAALHRLQELKKQGKLVDDSDESEEDDEDEDEDEEGLIPRTTELRFYETLSKIKQKDPSIYQKDVKLFDEIEKDEEEGMGESEEKKKEDKNNAKKAIYLKDVVAKQLLEDGPDFEEKDLKKVNHPKTYVEEQDELKRAFLQASAADDDDEGLISVKKKSAEEIRKEKEEELEAIKEAEQRAKDADIAQRLNQYFGRDDDLDENERFLKNYLLNKGWIDRDNKGSSYEDIVGVSEDEEELENQDRFEAEYNFRFEEGAGDQVLGHPRFPEGSIRKKTSARSLQRMRKQARTQIAEFERKEEIKHLKNIKKKEIFEKLQKVRAVAGLGSDEEVGLKEDDIEKDFDPDEYDRKMREAFGDEYYRAEDPDVDFHGRDDEDLEKPDFDAEDELLGLPEGWDDPNSEGFNVLRQKVKEHRKEMSQQESFADDAGKEENAGDDAENEENPGDDAEKEEDAGDDADENMIDTDEHGALKTKKKRKGRISLREKLALDRQLEEYYKLDYEDVIGDIRTRFKYREVQPNSYGLKTEEILMTDDKDLNQFVSIKKLAPYRNKEWAPPKKHVFSQKKRKRIALLDQFTPGHVKKKHKKQMNKTKRKQENCLRNGGQKDKQREENTSQVAEQTEENDGTAPVSKKRRRRPKKKKPELPASRLLAYGQLPSGRGKKK
eukprot:TRINITY_DN2609_c0_g1_i1.p1 TRINITY_DN2609_c0_g1~~TRINITY_DN2609_c0_g1_i1.p1  ORF type:complete len:702 (-),score=222.67 TRINITY_DN2609_c0_g1_i1:327-2432(-)